MSAKKVVMVTDEESTRVDVSTQDSSSVRQLMKEYWDRWAEDTTESGTSLELMVGERNYKQAMEFHELDRAELLGMLPFKGKDVLELGGGSGRYSGEVAKVAKSVIATDFIESFVKENEELHGKDYPNMTFRTLDAAKLDYPPESLDFIFSNWLLMYLNNVDTAQYAYNNLMMLRPGGYSFFRESHFRPVGSRPQAVNPTIYRSMKEYYDYFSKTRYTDKNGDKYFFDLIFAGNSQTYVHTKRNPTQVYYLWQKTKVTDQPSTVSIQAMLDSKIYNEENILVFDKVIGDGFITPGGLDCSKDLVSKLNLKPDSSVLDVGCGLGGLVAYLNKDCDIETTGLELSIVASQAAILRMNKTQTKKGHLHIADMARTNFAANSFDAIFARETLEYIGNKNAMLKRALKWLRPCGQLLLGSYCLGKEIISGEAAGLLKSEGLDIVSIDSLAKLVEEVGYTDIKCEDYSQQYIEFLNRDLTTLESTEGIPEKTKLHFAKLWQFFVTGLINKDLRFAVIIATKQPNSD